MVKKELLSTVMKRTSEWILSQEIPSDVTVHVGGTFFALHKFPLVSKCGYIRKLILKCDNRMKIPDIPGGSKTFELAAKFCYGVNFEISIENIASLRCAAEYLEMTEDYAVGNLVGLTEAYLTQLLSLESISGAVSILHSSQKLIPIAENVKLVNRSIDKIADIATNSGLDNLSTFRWAEDLSVLGIDFFRRVLIAMMARGFKQYALGPILMLYAHKSLQDLEISGHEKRLILETIVSLLPRDKNVLSVSFVSMLLRAAIYLDTTISCRVDLEKRISLQLGQATLEDLLIPSTSDTTFDVEAVQRIMMNFIEHEMVENRPTHHNMEQVGKLMEDFLAKIASDSNLSVSTFVGIAEIIPEQSRITDDGMYKAIDTYLKVHPALGETERKDVCSVMNCQKLSTEACVHAAQNERLPLQITVQVLYYEQQRLHGVMINDSVNSGTDEATSLKRENQDLKFELMEMKMRVKEIEKSCDKSVALSACTDNKSRLPRQFISSVSKKLGKMYTSFGADGVVVMMPSGSKGQVKPRQDRRYSIS